MGEAAEMAGDAVGVAVVGGQCAPGGGGEGEMEDGVHAAAEVRDAAAGRGAGEEIGEEGVPLGIGEGAKGLGWGEAGEEHGRKCSMVGWN
ncbi:hypothetical protein ROTAS13_02283 [Roseomonas sp. TAS13]|nr:hypothetical protein ROTAS13_02283 [Roseomonas sp. TAS13]